MTPPVKQCSFAAGEISPTLYARTDLNRYEIGLRTMRNFIAMRQGGATNRPGTQYIGTTLNGGNPVRLIPFIFNETGLGQSYMLEFGAGYIAFYQNGGVVVVAPNTPFTVATPYLQADLAALDYGQSADILTITHPSYPVRELIRSGPLSWTFFTNTLQHSGLGVNVSATGGGSGAFDYSYYVTAIDAAGNETVLSAMVPAFLHLIAQTSPSNPVQITWVPSAGPSAVKYNIYVLINGGGIGFIGATANLFFTDAGTTPDYSHAPPILNTTIGVSAGNYPSTVGFIQQRRGFANTINNPIGFWLSRTGSYDNFNLDINPTDADPIFGSIAAEEVNAVEHLLELKFMLLLTAGTEIYVQGDGFGIVTSAQVNAAVQSHYGASALRPIKIGDVLLFVQSLGSSIRDFSFDFASDGYRGNDITIFSAHLFEKYQVNDWCFQKVPDSLVWIARSDGTLLCCTYVREQQVLAWSRHDFTNGFVENMCAIPENGEYVVYLSIRRVIRGQTVRYIERMSSRLWSDSIDATYLDSFLTYDGRNETNTTMELTSTITIVTGVNDSIPIESPQNNPIGTAIIAGGVYTIDQLLVALQVALDAVAPTVFTVSTATSIASDRNRRVIVVEESSLIERFSFNFTGLTRSAGPTLGFPLAGNYLSSVGPLFFVTATTAPVYDFSTSDTAYQQNLLLTSSFPGFFTSDIVGKAIFMNDDEWNATNGVSGNQLRLIIQVFIDSRHVTVTPNTIVIEEFQAFLTTDWALAVKSVTGLTHLASEEVSIWADRYVVGSPLNSQIATVYTVSFDGIVTLDKWYSVVHVGLPMVSDLQTLDLETSFGETELSRRKKINRFVGYVYNTRTFFAGTENPDTAPNNTDDDPLYGLEEFKRGASMSDYDQPPELTTDQDYVLTEARWNKNGRVFIRNVDPVPCSILAISPQGDDPVQQATGKRV